MDSNFVQNIFSLKNTKTHKVITILGVKIKLKSYRIMYRNLDKTYQKLKEKNERYLNGLKTNPDMYEIYVKNPELEKKDKEYAPMVRDMIETMYKTGVPLFSMVEIETMNKCNGECAFCPVNKFDDPREFKRMDEDLFRSIIYQLKEINFKGRISIFSNNEPLMDKRIFDFVKYIKKELPSIHLSFFTNGLLLDIEKFNKLIPDCDTFCIDIYYADNEYIPNNIMPIVNECMGNKSLQTKVKIQLINKNAIRNNRGGKSKNRKNIYKLETTCLLPFKQVIIRPDGKLSLCCNDASGSFTLGDLTKEKLTDIWYNNNFKEIRDKLRYNRRQIDMCDKCDNFGGFGTNLTSDYVFTQDEYKSSWEKVKTILNETPQIPPPNKIGSTMPIMPNAKIGC